MYRPQYLYDDAERFPGCIVQPCEYCFDASNTYIFQGNLAANAISGRIPLHLDVDADFYLRAFTFQLPAEGPIYFRLEDSESNPLSDSDNAIETTNFELPSEYAYMAGAGTVVLDAGAGGVLGVAGGNFNLFLKNGATLNVLTRCAINLYGVKVYKGGCA